MMAAQQDSDESHNGVGQAMYEGSRVEVKKGDFITPMKQRTGIILLFATTSFQIGLKTSNVVVAGKILLSTIIMLHHVTHLPLPSLLSLIRKQDITLPVLQSYHIWADACTYITHLNISINTVKYPGVPKRYS